ncbi:hypothetical protein V6N13_142791 [Hibiscus sabdariffa]
MLCMGSSVNKRVIPLVTWLGACMSTSQGGLGLWVQVLRHKCKCSDDVLLSLESRNCLRLWKGVSVLWELVRNDIVWSLGNGENVDLWRDVWLRDVDPFGEFA